MPHSGRLLSESDMAALQTPTWDFSRSAAGARVLVATGMDRGVAQTALLAGTGLTPDDLDNPTAEIEAGQELAIARNLLARTGNVTGLGVEAGTRYTLGSFGIWGFALMTCPTVRDLARLGTDYAALSFAFIRPVYEEDAHRAIVVYDDSEIPDDVRDLFVERELAKMFTLAPVVLGGLAGFWIETVFTGARADALRRAARGVPVRSARPRHLLNFERSLLDASLPQADPATATAMEAQCAELVQRRRQRRGLAAHVRARILADLADPPALHRIAAEMHVDVRTLRRKLADENTSYRELADEVRAAVAIGLLADAGLPVEAVASRLGYHDGAGFTRAFKRWTGETPGRSREHVRLQHRG